MINALAQSGRTAFSAGEISQGEAYARRVEALVQEARGSPDPGWRKDYAIYGQSWEADAAGVAALAHGVRTANMRKPKSAIGARKRSDAPR